MSLILISCCWLTLAAICLTSLVRNFRAFETRKSWYVEMVFYWPVMVLYKLAAKTRMWLSIAKFLPISMNNFLVIVRTFCKCSTIFALKILYISVYTRLSYRLFWVYKKCVWLYKIVVVRELSNISKLDLMYPCLLISLSVMSELYLFMSNIQLLDL